MSLRNTERRGMGRSTGGPLIYYKTRTPLLNITYDGEMAPTAAPAQAPARMDQGAATQGQGGCPSKGRRDTPNAPQQFKMKKEKVDRLDVSPFVEGPSGARDRPFDMLVYVRRCDALLECAQIAGQRSAETPQPSARRHNRTTDGCAAASVGRVFSIYVLKLLGCWVDEFTYRAVARSRRHLLAHTLDSITLRAYLAGRGRRIRAADVSTSVELKKRSRDAPSEDDASGSV
ncbi:hypothetical protein GEV33_013674 [Tenebrio molitor]|uniref:Uncharacterized protein n=1 Tax=Tenebrio molitor TaxID=7067 RepID=A0A8J6L6C4_TENMO|nr:hypothetical protein GEV33_013674 [Tenebrio molitor]